MLTYLLGAVTYHLLNFYLNRLKLALLMIIVSNVLSFVVYGVIGVILNILYHSRVFNGMLIRDPEERMVFHLLPQTRMECSSFIKFLDDVWCFVLIMNNKTSSRTLKEYQKLLSIVYASNILQSSAHTNICFYVISTLFYF